MDFQNGLPKEIIAAILMLYKNTKVRSPDGDTDFFDIVACVQQGDTLALYLLIICQDYVLRTNIDLMKENGFILANASGGARGVIVIVLGNGHGDTSSNPGREWLHFT